MDNNELFYKAEYERLTFINSSFEKRNRELTELLIECWMLLKIKGAWLALSAKNIEEMSRYFDSKKEDE